MKFKKILLVFGTHPETIKIIPPVLELKTFRIRRQSMLIVQHREMLVQVLNTFDLTQDYNLNLI